MTTTIKDLESERDALQKQIAEIDLDTLSQAAQTAAAARDAYTSPSLHIDDVERGLTLAAGEADRALQDGKYRLRDLSRKVAPLVSMLTAPGRVEAAQNDLDVLETRKAFATTAIADSSRTVEALQGLLNDACATYQAERDSAAKAVLSDVKAGKEHRGKMPDRAQCAALESALGLAESELADAQEAHALIETEYREAMASLAAARVDAARLTMEIESRNFVKAVVQFKALTGDFDFADLEQRVLICEASDAVG